jgi:hypothetical protein
MHDVRLYEGSYWLGGDDQPVLHEDSTEFGALPADTGRATQGQPFHAKTSLASYRSACG